MMKILNRLCIFTLIMGLLLVIISFRLKEILIEEHENSKISVGIVTNGHYQETNSGYLIHNDEGVEWADTLIIIGSIVSAFSLFGVICTKISINNHKNDPQY